jgi:hypothetical protein
MFMASLKDIDWNGLDELLPDELDELFEVDAPELVDWLIEAPALSP